MSTDDCLWLPEIVEKLQEKYRDAMDQSPLEDARRIYERLGERLGIV